MLRGAGLNSKINKLNMNLNLNTLNSLVTLSVTTRQPSWSFRDKRATERLRSVNGGGTARVNDNLWEKTGHLSDASRIITTAAAKLREFGLPQSKGGVYYIQRRDIGDIQAVADIAASALAEAKVGIVRDFPEILAANQARVSLGGAKVKWPASGEILAAKFGLEVRWTSAPAVIQGDVLAGLTDEVAARVRAASEAQVEADFRAAHGAPLEDLLSQVGEAIEQLSAGKRLRSERFAALQAAAERLGRLNWLDLPSLSAVSAAVAGAVEIAATDAASLSSPERQALAGTLKEAKALASDALAGLL